MDMHTLVVHTTARVEYIMKAPRASRPPGRDAQHTHPENPGGCVWAKEVGSRRPINKQTNKHHDKEDSTGVCTVTHIVIYALTTCVLCILCIIYTHTYIYIYNG